MPGLTDKGTGGTATTRSAEERQRSVNVSLRRVDYVR
jgi:hypothetical protein